MHGKTMYFFPAITLGEVKKFGRQTSLRKGTETGDKQWQAFDNIADDLQWKIIDGEIGIDDSEGNNDQVLIAYACLQLILFIPDLQSRPCFLCVYGYAGAGEDWERFCYRLVGGLAVSCPAIQKATR